MREDDFRYFERRAKEETERARAEKHHAVAAVHRRLADGYRARLSNSPDRQLAS
jgi:hypothetical protein